jgi:hypothetical protein
MFRALATILVDNDTDAKAAANKVLTQLRPSLAQEYLERFWFSRRNPAFNKALGIESFDELVGHHSMGRRKYIDPLSRPDAPPLSPIIVGPGPSVQWHHLVYAALLEQTRMVEIFRRLVFECLHGERLPRVSQRTQRWLHITEQLFFADAWQYSVRSVTSRLRPDRDAVRRNAYWRMLGWDLQHGTEDGRPYPYLKADAANQDFTVIFEALLAEVWRAFTNLSNESGVNETDDNAIETLVRRLREMLKSRRVGAALSREEFDAVATLSWFHLTVEFDTKIIEDFHAQGGIADRLKLLGDLVGVPAHSLSDAFFQLAVPVSTVLRGIESEAVTTASELYRNGGLFQKNMLTIITHWSVATGRSVKDLAARRSVGQVLTQAARLEPAQLTGDRMPVAAR